MEKTSPKEDLVFSLLCHFFFDGIISVNSNLLAWATKKLHSSRNIFLNNFILNNNSKPNLTKLLGEKNEYKIACLANLRPQKDHLNLLKAFLLVRLKYQEISVHLIGNTSDEEYSDVVSKFIQRNCLENSVYMHGEQSEVEALLREADMGVLASSSEGLPLALLEYGVAGLPVVCTKVGESQEVVGCFGKVVEANDPEALAQAIIYYLENPEERKKDALALKGRVELYYSEGRVMKEVLIFYIDIISSKRNSPLSTESSDF